MKRWDKFRFFTGEIDVQPFYCLLQYRWLFCSYFRSGHRLFPRSSVFQYLTTEILLPVEPQARQVSFFVGQASVIPPSGD